MVESWRYLETLGQSGRFNMAADQVLLEQFQRGDLPTLRLYTWNPPTLSMGKSQKLDSINTPWCRNHGIDIVRRTTGGQAVLHGQDITYSLIGDAHSARFSGGILKIYQTLSQVFFHFFQALGLSPQLQPHSRRQRAEQASQVCFAVPSAFEILVEGKKIIGSAQRQTSQGFLQHGTIPLMDQTQTLAGIFKNTPPATLQNKITALETLGVFQHHSEEAVWRLLIDSFQEVFNISLNQQTWSSAEAAAIAKAEADFPSLV